MGMMTFINLPVKDLARSTEFFRQLGFSFDEQFTDENATRMIISDETSAMLVVEPFFQGFIGPLDIADTTKSREVLVGLSAESREQVDDLAEKAIAAGAKSLGDPDDQGFMYMRGSATSTATSGRSSTWTCPRCQRGRRSSVASF